MSVNIALYARFSSDLQNPRSAEDQLALCRDYVHRHWPDADLIVEFKDEALSGQSMNRVGLKALLATLTGSDAQGNWVVVTENMDRLSRDLGDMADIFKRLMIAKADLFSLDRGKIDFLQMGILGTISAYYVQDLVRKVRRGQRAKARRGLFPAGLSYGYRVVRDAVDEDGRPVSGQRAIDSRQARVVQHIFQLYDNGATARAIAHNLNDENIPSARGNLWRAGSILDILRNPLYKGELVYNRKTLSPNRRHYVANPVEQWEVTPRPDLRIIDDELWLRVQERRRYGRSVAPPKAKRAFDHFGHLVRCGVCGSHCVMADRRRLTCNAAKHHKRCRNYRRITENELMENLVEQARRSVSISELPTLIHEVNNDEKASVLQARQRLKDVDDELAHWRMAISQGVRSQQSIERMLELEHERRKTVPIAELDRLVTLNASDDLSSIMRVGLKKLENLRLEWKGYLVRELLPIIVEDIVMTPIADQPRGSRISIRFRKRGWPMFLQKVSEIFLPSQNK